MDQVSLVDRLGHSHLYSYEPLVEKLPVPSLLVFIALGMCLEKWTAPHPL